MNFKDLTGQTFERYTVLSYAGRRRGHSVWLCRCICGREKVVDGQCLRAGGTKSCGCFRDEQTKAMVGRNTKPYGEASFNGLYSNYKTRAGKTGKEFSFTKEEFRDITSSPCKYCGVLPSQEFLGNGQSNGIYVYNGIDRVDSTKGYTLNNSVPCCAICNYAKNDFTLEVFQKWLDRLVKFRTQPESPAIMQGNEETNVLPNNTV